MTAEVESDLPPWHGVTAPFEEMFLGDAEAIAFMRIMSRWSHLYDDLIDKNTEVSEDVIHAVMWDITVGLASNRFYIANAHVFAPIIATGILNWRAATDMERLGSEEELHISHALRYSGSDIALMIMTVLGGPAHAAFYARQAKLALQQDTFAHYSREHSDG